MKDLAELEFALQDCLEAMLRGGKTLDEALSRYPHLHQELAPLLESALWVRSQQGALSPSLQRQTVLRERVLKAVQAEPLPLARRPSRSIRPRPSLFSNRAIWAWSAFIFFAICLLAFAASGVALASQNSLPGDRLYGVKAAVEEAGVLLTWDAAQRTRLRLEYAERRLDESARLSRQGRFEEMSLALSNYEVQLYLAMQEAAQMANTQPLRAQQLKAEIETRLQAQIETLVALENFLPPAQAQVAQQAQNASQQALQSAASILSGIEITSTPTTTFTALASATAAEVQITLPVLLTPTEAFMPPGLLRQTQSPTPRPSLTPRPTNTHRPTKIVQPSKTPKPTQVKPPTKTPKPSNPNKPTSPPGQSKPTKTPKK